jgi:DNA-binding CsgD family transcriptional regulator
MFLVASDNDYYRAIRVDHPVMRVADGPGAAWGVGPRLTPREREVLDRLAGGKTDRDIGQILGISPRTVHKHLQRIYEKLGVETRTAAVSRAFL